VVTGLIQRRDENKAKGLPAGNLYHVISSPRITFPKPGEALYQSYWQTMRKDKDGRMITGGMGRSEDSPGEAQRQVADSVPEADGFHGMSVPAALATRARGERVVGGLHAPADLSRPRSSSRRFPSKS
jgi:hypothetical protein